MQLPIELALRTACIRQDRTALQIRQDPLYHRNNLEDGRTEVYDIRIPDNLRQIRPCIVHCTAVHRRAHGLLRTAEPCNVDLVTESLFEAQPE